MKFFREKQVDGPPDYPGTNGYGDEMGPDGYDDDLQVQCPPHTTERKLVARIDFHVVPFLCIMYLLAFLDRVNIGNAAIYGLIDELKLTGDKYNVALVRIPMSKRVPSL